MAFEELSSIELLARAKGGERPAAEALFDRYAPRLRRWAAGRLPPWARDMADTSDLVQDTLLQVSKRLDAVAISREGDLLAYLRQALLNRVRNELRRASRRPAALPIDDQEQLQDLRASPLDRAIGQEMVDRYEAALAQLPAGDRELIVARMELGYTFDEIATIFEKPSADAARVACARALVRLARDMSGG